MSEKAKGRTRAPKTKPPQPKGTVELVVRRGALRRFDALKKKTADLPVTVTWDRRTDQGRSQATSTAGGPGVERRKAPPATWDLADFVVVEADSPAQAAARKKR